MGIPLKRSFALAKNREKELFENGEE